LFNTFPQKKLTQKSPGLSIGTLKMAENWFWSVFKPPLWNLRLSSHGFFWFFWKY